MLGNVDDIAVSTDDMTYYGTKYYKHFNIFKQENVKKDLENLLLDNGFTRDEIEKILCLNFKRRILDRVSI